jgi:hypothetical protein
VFKCIDEFPRIVQISDVSGAKAIGIQNPQEAFNGGVVVKKPARPKVVRLHGGARRIWILDFHSFSSEAILGL